MGLGLNKMIIYKSYSLKCKFHKIIMIKTKRTQDYKRPFLLIIYYN